MLTQMKPERFPNPKRPSNGCFQGGWERLGRLVPVILLRKILATSEGSGPEVIPEGNPSEPVGTKGKGPSSKESGKAPATKPKLSTSAEGVQVRAQTTLFGGATLAQAMGSEEDVTRRLENYTGLLDGLQKLVGVMASGYEDATEDIRSLVASTLDAATKRDRAFVAGASQALTE